MNRLRVPWSSSMTLFRRISLQVGGSSLSHSSSPPYRPRFPSISRRTTLISSKNQSTPTSLIAHSLSDNDTPTRPSPSPAAVGRWGHSSSSVIVRFIKRFDGTAAGSSILRAASAPATGSFAGSSSPSCTRAEAWSQWMCSWWILSPSK